MKNKKILCIATTVLIITVLLIGVSIINPTINGKPVIPTGNVYAATLKTINTNMDTLMAELEKEMTNNPELTLIGSPIRLIEESQAYKKIIELGLSGVKPLYDKLYDSRDAGLYEYILALAIEDITKEDFVYNTDYGWKNSLEFRLSYETKVNTVEANVERILNTEFLTNEEKTLALEEQGIFAVSFLMMEYNDENSKIDKNIIETAVLEITSEYESSPVENVNTYSLNRNDTTDINIIKEKCELFDSLVDLNGKAYN